MNSARAHRLYGIGRLLRFLGALRRPFVGHASGATFIEYLVICGLVALGAIQAFKRFGATTRDKVDVQAEMVANLRGAVPKPGSVLQPRPGTSMFGPGKPKLSLPIVQDKCFAAGTLVLTEHGDQAIEAVAVGQRVWARDESTGEDRLARVVRTFVTPNAPVIGVDVPFDVGKSELLRVTPEHPFWVRDFGWTAAHELNGVLLEARAPEALASESVSTSSLAALASAVESWGERTTVYNFEVEGLHSYFVGRAHVLVHNACALEVKTYEQWKNDPNRPPGSQIHHLNQDKAFGTVVKDGKIPREEGASIPLDGMASVEGTQHWKFHRSLEDFWDQYRDGGKYGPNEKPTVGQYAQAMEQALRAADIDRDEAKRIADEAHKQLNKYWKDTDKVPKVPGRFMRKSDGTWVFEDGDEDEIDI